MDPRDLTRRRIRAAIVAGYVCIFFAALALAAVDDDEDQAAAVDRCPFDIAPEDPPVHPDEVDRMMARESAAYRAGWLEHERQRLAGDLPARR